MEFPSRIVRAPILLAEIAAGTDLDSELILVPGARSYLRELHLFPTNGGAVVQKEFSFVLYDGLYRTLQRRICTANNADVLIDAVANQPLEFTFDPGLLLEPGNVGQVQRGYGQVAIYVNNPSDTDLIVMGSLVVEIIEALPIRA